MVYLPFAVTKVANKVYHQTSCGKRMFNTEIIFRTKRQIKALAGVCLAVLDLKTAQRVSFLPLLSISKPAGW